MGNNGDILVNRILEIAEEHGFQSGIQLSNKKLSSRFQNKLILDRISVFRLT